MDVKNYFSTKRIAFIGLFAALVFVSNYLSVPLPVPVGADVTRIHLGNSICLLSGFMLGGIGGGFAAGIGSFFFDLFDPKYAPEAYITLVFKFMLAFVCGILAYKGKNRLKFFPQSAAGVAQNVFAAICGSLTYIALYLGKSFVKDRFFLSLPVNSALANVAVKAGTSFTNAALAVIISVPLSIALKKALEMNKISLK